MSLNYEDDSAGNMKRAQSFVDMGWVSQIDTKAITRIDKSYILQDFSEKEAIWFTI